MRWAYLMILGFASLPAAAVFVLTLPLAVLHRDEPFAGPMLAGGVLSAAAWLFAFAALGFGLAAVRPDDIVRPRARTSARLALLGAVLAWPGVPLVLAIGAVQHAHGVDRALAIGLFYALSCLFPAVVNNRIRRLSAAAA